MYGGGKNDATDAGAGGGDALNNGARSHHVRFADAVHVREHVALERQLSATGPVVNPLAERALLPDGRLGTFRTFLSWNVAREYDT
jgi:hypothetical protein